ncbi:uncharacterized protein LOC113311225 [Papaver somniferum]|uniref:uncharacterized protein LOC113311225 n=1 Tax=Papaver somniferum TaxID=3469 RepID=UPI000E70256A|nr:uncharacterized protein LOC113311225 [Papaver somniferum]
MFGNYEDSYKDVPIFCAMVAHTNPGSVNKYTYGKKDKTFMSMTISFAAPMRGWKKTGRPVIGLDACHLTGKRGGVLMAATTLDGQNNLVPLGIRKGLLEAVPKVFPGARVRYYFRHLYKNFKKYYKAPTLHNSLWNACKAYKVKHFHHFDSICKENADAGEYLRKEDPSTWSRDYFDPLSCCEHMNKNFSESFNSMASNMRDKPIIQLGMMYGQLVMGLLFKRREESAKWNENGLVPATVKLINNMLDLVGKFDTEGSVVGQVYLPKLERVSGFYCAPYYSVEYYRTTYANVVTPLEDITEWVWEDKATMDINLNPPYQRKTGRPAKKSKKSYDQPETVRDQPESSTAKGKAKVNRSKGTSLFVGESSAGPSTQGRPPT